MDAFIEFCQSWTMGGIAARLFLATLAGVIIGMDREYKIKEPVSRPMPWSASAPLCP